MFIIYKIITILYCLALAISKLRLFFKIKRVSNYASKITVIFVSNFTAINTIEYTLYYIVHYGIIVFI